MADVVFQSVEDFFNWKLNIGDVKTKKSVEEYNREKTDELKWTENGNDYKKTDVLYSFLLIYQLGLKVTNKEAYIEIYNQEKSKTPKKRLSPNSPAFLHTCSQASEYKEFNESKELTEYLKVYFSIGNVIPIWPGGNVARGSMGLYDIPEIFFNIYSDWTKRLMELYPNACLDAINAPNFIVKRNSENGYIIKGYKDIFETKKQFESAVMANKQAYYDYLIRRCSVIKSREEALS